MKNNKALGQHWLKNRAILEEIAELAAGSGGLCVEIGPGLGFLTSSLLRRFDKVIAVEFDERLANNLPKSFPGKNLEVVNQDFLKYDLDAINEPYVIAGNIPYYITSPIIEKVLTTEKKPSKVVLLIQREVAERILDKKETQLSLFVKNRAKVLPGLVVLKNEFTPPPKVDSQVVVFEPYNKTLISEEVFGLIQKGFLAPRKKLVHNLVGVKSKDEVISVMERVGLDPDARPGDLGLYDWEKLFKELS